MTQAYPLQWPRGRARTKNRAASAFKVTASKALDELYQGLSRFGASSVVVSTNIPTRFDGTPYRDGLTEPLEDPGVAVYFTKRKRAICLPCDTYRRPWENIVRAAYKAKAREAGGASVELNAAQDAGLARFQ